MPLGELEASPGKQPDTMQIRRVANGWVVMPGSAGPNDFTHVYTGPDELAEHVKKWAQAQRDF